MAAAGTTVQGTGDARSDRPRLHPRYPIEVDLACRIVKRGRVRHLGRGRTVNISSGGVLFLPNDAQRFIDTVNAGDILELVLDWPVLLQRICLLKLVIRGEIVRRDGESLALRTTRYEFRTGGMATQKAS